MTSVRSKRSYAPLTDEHLDRLTAIAADWRVDFCECRPAYRDRLLGVVLAQGAARHYRDGVNGVKDLDVWSFFAWTDDGRGFPYRGEWRRDFGPSELGRELRADGKWTGYEGRRVDLLTRALRVGTDAEPAEAIRSWLRGRSKSAWWLRQKPVIMLDPRDRRGEVVWSADRDEAH